VHQEDAGVHREESGVVGGGHWEVSVLQTLMKHDLVDAFWLKIFPVTLGWKTIVCQWHHPGGIQGDGKHRHLERRILVNYERAGAVPTGSL
jgi:hypothetical protein